MELFQNCCCLQLELLPFSFQLSDFFLLLFFDLLKSKFKNVSRLNVLFFCFAEDVFRLFEFLLKLQFQWFDLGFLISMERLKFFMVQDFELNEFLLKLEVLFSFERDFLIVVFLQEVDLVDSFFVKVTQWRLIFLFELLKLFFNFVDTVFDVVNDAIFLNLDFSEVFDMAFFSIFW